MARAAAALLAALVTSGCAGSPAALAAYSPPPAVASVRLQLVSLAAAGPLPRPGGGGAPYGLQSLVSGYTAADVDHVVLELYRAGSPVPGVASAVPAASLAAPVLLRNLRAATSYEVRATAYADAAGATVISEPAASRAAFSTPAVVTTAGLDAIDDAPVAVPLAVTLASRPVGARLVFKVVPTAFIRNKSTHLRIKLLAGATIVSERVETLAAAQLPHTLTNLKLGTGYAIVAQGITQAPERQQSADASSTLTFTTPAAGGASVEDDLNVLLGTGVAAVPCSK